MSDDLDTRAAEYVIGQQGAAEREAIRREMEHNADLRMAVARWEARLLPLAQTTSFVAPSPELLARIKAGLPPRAANDDVAALRDAVRRWRNIATLAGGIAAVLAVFVGVRSFSDARKPGETYVAAVNRGGDAPALIVRVDLASGRVFVRPVAAETPAGKSLELWYIGGQSRRRAEIDGARERPRHAGASVRRQYRQGEIRCDGRTRRRIADRRPDRPRGLCRRARSRVTATLGAMRLCYRPFAGKWASSTKVSCRFG